MHRCIKTLPTASKATALETPKAPNCLAFVKSGKGDEELKREESAPSTPRQMEQGAVSALVCVCVCVCVCLCLARFCGSIFLFFLYKGAV